MTYLIDTHVLLWYMWDDPRLPEKIKKEIEDDSIGKLELRMPVLELENYFEQKSMIQLDFDFQDLDILSKLPFHHNDPFDRLIVSQAMNRNLVVITDDNKFHLYPVQLL